MRIYGLLITQEPLVNGEIPEYGTRRSKGAPLRFNRRSMNSPYADGGSSVKHTGNVKQIMEQVPAVNGNTVRGQPRRPFILETLQILETPEKSVHPEIIHFIANGGGTGKNDSPGSEQFKFKQEIRKTLPFAHLLGGALRGMFIEGMLKVGFAYPVIEQTRWMINNTPLKDKFADTKLLDAEDLRAGMDVIRLTRRKLGDDFIPYSESEELPEDYEEAMKEPVKADEDEPDREKGAIYAAESLPAGVPLYTYFEIQNSKNEILNAALHAFVQTFIESGRLGGYKGKGCGSVSTEFMYDDGTPFNPEIAEKYWQYLKDNKDAINDYLANQLPNFFKSSDAAKENNKQKK